MIKDVKSTFSYDIEQPIEVLIGTMEGQQELEKKAAVADKAATKQELSNIAREIRELEKPYLQSFEWLHSMSEELT